MTLTRTSVTPPRLGLRLLDACCGAGGAGTGLHRAGFDVTGVDIAPQPNYPFTFHQADAITFIREHGHEFDLIAAGPPCQADCTLTATPPAERQAA